MALMFKSCCRLNGMAALVIQIEKKYLLQLLLWWNNLSQMKTTLIIVGYLI